MNYRDQLWTIAPIVNENVLYASKLKIYLMLNVFKILFLVQIL